MSINAYLVEDDELSRKTLKCLLEEQADIHVIGGSATENEAVAWILLHPFEWQLIIVDLELMQGHGLRVLSTCRVRGTNQKTIVLSGELDGRMRERCFDQGADAVFDKSTDLGALLAYCRRLAGRPAQHALPPSVQVA